MPLSTKPAENKSPDEYVVESAMRTTGPPYHWPISLHASTSVIGIGCAYASPFRTAASSDSFQGANSSSSSPIVDTRRVNGVASGEKRVG